MFFQIKSYLFFLIQSVTQKKPNAPLLDKIISNCFYKKANESNFKKFCLYKKTLTNNTSTINVIDFGAGSRVFKSNQRKVCDIAKHAGIKEKQATLLINIVEHFKPKNILEIGTSLGLATFALAINNSAKITSLEGCPQTAKIAKENLQKFNINAKIIVGNFNETLSNTLKNDIFNLIYFDGNHQKEATLNYFKECLKASNENSIFIFDDIHWSKSMEEAWNEIKNHPKVITTIDTFQWGIVLFNKEHKKHHYTIRI